MRQFCGHRPSGSMAVAIVALVVAMSGTAVAASSLVNGDKLIKMNSLSGNRLRNHTVSGKQINLEGLGKVPSAVVADSATSAGHASTADNATNATNASEFGGLPPSTFVHGSGQVFTAHVILTSSSETPIVTVPGIGQLDGSVSGGFVTFLVTGGTNQTGQEVDEIVGQMIQGVVPGVVAPSRIPRRRFLVPRLRTHRNGLQPLGAACVHRPVRLGVGLERASRDHDREPVRRVWRWGRDATGGR